MNKEQITTLQKLLSEINNSMTRADAEKDLQAEITLRAARECGVDKKDFAALPRRITRGICTSQGSGVSTKRICSRLF